MRRSAHLSCEDLAAVWASEVVHLISKIVNELQNPNLEEGGNVAANLSASVCEDLNPYMEDPKGLVSAVAELAPGILFGVDVVRLSRLRDNGLAIWGLDSRRCGRRRRACPGCRES